MPVITLPEMRLINGISANSKVWSGRVFLLAVVLRGFAMKVTCEHARGIWAWTQFRIVVVQPEERSILELNRGPILEQMGALQN